MITLQITPYSCATWTTERISCSTKQSSPLFSAPTLMTISTSRAPSMIARRAS